MPPYSRQGDEHDWLEQLSTELKQDVWSDDDQQLELQYYCAHTWKPILLLFTTVWDCKKCGAKKEEI